MDRDDNGLEHRRSDAPAGLFLSRRGGWYHDGDRVGHRGLEGLLHRSIARASDGSLIVTTGRDVLPFVAEDAPVIVKTLQRTPDDLWLVLASGALEAVAGRAFTIDDAGRVRTRVRDGAFWALLSRTATQVLLEHVGDDGLIATLRGPVTLDVVGGAQDWSRPPERGPVA